MMDEQLGVKDLALRARITVDIEDNRKPLESENTEFDYGHNVQHFSEDE